MHNIFVLAFEYFKIGCVAIGGGYTVIPFLYYLVDKYKWFEVSEITQMIAVSNLTPGPIGINMATFVGIKVGGVLSAALVTVSFMIPSFFIICLLAKFLKNSGENKCINIILYVLRPAAVALIAVAGLKIMSVTVFNVSKFFKTHNFTDLISIKAFILLLIFSLAGIKLKKNPMLLIVAAIVIGFLFEI